MNRIVAIVSIILVLVIQVALWPELTERVMPAFCLAMAIAWGGVAGRLAGFRLAVLLGIILDLYAQHSFGTFTVAMCAGAGVPALFARDEDLGLATQAVALAVGAIVYEVIILLWISAADAQAAFFANLLTVATLNSVGTVVVGLLMTFAATVLQRAPRPHDQRPVRF